MEFVETPTFTWSVTALMEDRDYAALQTMMAVRPDLGVLIPRSDGLRKVRWRGSGRGKRGGLRIIYYWQAQQQRIWMLLAYAKNEAEDLTPAQLRQLRILAKEFLQ